MADRPAFQQHQYAFAAHIRDPETNPAPEGIEDRRMAIYRNLFFNNVSQLLAKTFPVLHKILGADAWKIADAGLLLAAPGAYAAISGDAEGIPQVSGRRARHGG